MRNAVRLALMAMAFLAKWAAPTFSMAPTPSNDMEMSFGKHRGRLISEIVEDDPSYLQWLLGQAEAAGPQLEASAHPYVFPVDLDDGRLLEISWRKGDDHETVAHDFVTEKGLPEDNIPEIISFLKDVEQNHVEYRVDEPVSTAASRQLLEVAQYVRKHFPQFENAVVLGFGKHRGGALWQVVRDDPEYCSWMLETAAKADSSDQLRQAANWIQENHPDLVTQVEQWHENVDGQTTVTCGKHKGKSFQAVLQEDTDYVCWLIDNIGDEARSKNLRALISFARRHADCRGGVEVKQV